MATDNRVYDEYSNPYDRITLNWEGYLDLRDLHLRYMDEADRILDLGAGTGNQTAALVNAGKEVYAVDINDAMSSHILKKINHPEPRLILKTMDAEDLGFEDGFFDAVTAMNVIYNLANPEKGLSEAYRVLSKEGNFAMSGPLPGANIDDMLDDCRNQLKEKGIYDEESEKNLQLMKKANDHLVANATLYTVDELEEILIDKIGFDRILDARDNIYLGSAYFIAAKK